MHDTIRLTVRTPKPIPLIMDQIRLVEAVSPVVSMERVEDGVEITITDMHGPHTETVYDGRTETHVFEQASASVEWTIEHNLNRYPSVTVVDSAGSVCVGEVLYLDENTVKCLFSAPFSGVAYLN